MCSVPFAGSPILGIIESIQVMQSNRSGLKSQLTHCLDTQLGNLLNLSEHLFLISKMGLMVPMEASLQDGHN